MKKILIVDDDLALRSGLAAHLGANGYRVVFAADGASAVQVARREMPDLILLDLGLPGGDGYVVMNRLRQLMAVACIPIVIISARPPQPHRDQALEAGARAFVQKPLDNQELLRVIGNVLGVVS